MSSSTRIYHSMPLVIHSAPSINNNAYIKLIFVAVYIRRYTKALKILLTKITGFLPKISPSFNKTRAPKAYPAIFTNPKSLSLKSEMQNKLKLVIQLVKVKFDVVSSE